MADEERSFRDKMNLFFMGNVPAFADRIITKELENKVLAATKQNVKSLREINFVQLLNDGGSVVGPILKNEAGFDKNSIEDLQSSGNILIVSPYLEGIQNPNIEAWYKSDLAFFIRNIIETFTKIYKINLILDQDAFIADTIADEERFYRLAITELQYSKTEIYFEALFLKFAEELVRQDFLEIIPNNSKHSKHFYNWKKSKRHFMFFILLVFGKDDIVDDAVLNWIVVRFKFNETPTNIKVLKTTKADMIDLIQDKAKTVKGNYLKLQNIFH